MADAANIEGFHRRYIPSRTEKRYEILNQGRGIVIRKLDRPETKVIPEVYSKPVPAINPLRTTPFDPLKVTYKNVQKSETVAPQPPPSPITSSSSFEELKEKVTKMREEEKAKSKQIMQEVKKSIKEDKIDSDEDVKDLVEGTIAKEQELLSMDYLRGLEKHILRNVFEKVFGYRAEKGSSRYEMSKLIYDKCKEFTSSKKKIIYEASKINK
jgi:hypothetical protein